jgi:hypothetical protein
LGKTAEALDFVCNFDGQIGIPPIQDLLWIEIPINSSTKHSPTMTYF